MIGDHTLSAHNFNHLFYRSIGRYGSQIWYHNFFYFQGYLPPLNGQFFLIIFLFIFLASPVKIRISYLVNRISYREERRSQKIR